MPGKRWSEREMRSLKRKWTKTQRPAAVRISGRSANGVRRKLLREGLLEPRWPGRYAWKPAEEDKLRRLVARGLGAREIVEGGLIKRSRDSVAQKISRMGLLATKSRSRTLRECRRLSGDELNDFLTAIRQYGHHRHTGWFVWKYAVGRGKVKRALAREGMPVSWREAMRMPQTRSRFVSRASHASAEAWSHRRQELKEHLVERLHELEKELDKNPKLSRRAGYRRRQCNDCKAEWFASEEFFKPTWKRFPDGRRKRYFQRRCRICAAGRRGTTAKQRHDDAVVRRAWGERLAAFRSALVECNRTLYEGGEAPRVLRWEPFLRKLGRLGNAGIVGLAEGMVAGYTASGVNPVLAGVEKICFSGEPALHEDIWELDELARSEPSGRPLLARGEQIIGEGRAVALQVYRVLRLPEYALSLI